MFRVSEDHKSQWLSGNEVVIFIILLVMGKERSCDEKNVDSGVRQSWV